MLTEVLRPGLSALAYCSFHHPSCEMICEQNGVATVCRLLASGGGGKVTYGRPAKASAAMVLANMARDPSLRLVVVRGGGVPAAIRHLVCCECLCCHVSSALFLADPLGGP